MPSRRVMKNSRWDRAGLLDAGQVTGTGGVDPGGGLAGGQSPAGGGLLARARASRPGLEPGPLLRADVRSRGR